MSSSPRHRLDLDEDQPPRIYTGPIEVRSIDFDAVAPMRHPERYAPQPQTREPTGDGPDQLEDSDALYLAHS